MNIPPPIYEPPRPKRYDKLSFTALLIWGPIAIGMWCLAVLLFYAVIRLLLFVLGVSYDR